jgi:hypothetical protein
MSERTSQEIKAEIYDYIEQQAMLNQKNNEIEQEKQKLQQELNEKRQQEQAE